MAIATGWILSRCNVDHCSQEPLRVDTFSNEDINDDDDLVISDFDVELCG